MGENLHPKNLKSYSEIFRIELSQPRRQKRWDSKHCFIIGILQKIQLHYPLISWYAQCVTMGWQ